MSTLIKGAIAFGGLAGVGGISYGIYNAVRTPTYGEALKGTLLSTDKDVDNERWISRLTTLKAAEEKTLVEALNAIKKAGTSATADQLIAWCKTIINNSNKGKKDKEFQNIQSYCTYSINEKLTNAIPDTEKDDSTKWKKGYDTLKTITDDNKLDSDLITAKTKDETEGKKAIKKWCTESYKKPYKGEKDQDFINAQQICIDG